MKREGATILLVTHQVELLPEADTLVVMSEGAAVYVGAPTKNTISAFFPSHEHEMEEVDDALNYTAMLLTKPLCLLKLYAAN